MNILEAIKHNEQNPVRRKDNPFIYWPGELKHFNEYSHNDVTGEWEALNHEISISLEDFVRIYKETQPLSDDEILNILLKKLGA